MVVWENRPRPHIDVTQRAIALLTLGPTTTYGRDNLDLVYNPTDTDFDATAKGIRNLPLRVKVQTFRQNDPENAWAYLERVRTRLRWELAFNALNAIDCGLQGTSAVIPLDTLVDEHMASMAALDIFLTAELEETDPTAIPYIAEITGTGTIDDKIIPYTLVGPS